MIIWDNIYHAFAFPVIIIEPNIIKNKRNGKSTKIHAIWGDPASHIRFNTHVQNITYSILIKYNMDKDGISQK